MAAFVSNTTGVASRSVTVPAGTDRLLVAVALYGSTNTAQSATYGGVAMSVATNANGFVQIFYMLNPPAGAATLTVTGSSVDTVVAAHYTGVGSFQSPGQQASVASASFSPNAGGLIVFGMEATSTSHTPLAGTNERLDSAGTYYADRIVTGSGSVTVGVSSATGPDYAGAIFLDSVNASGTPTAPSPVGSGAASAGTSASGTPSAPSPTGSGSASVVVAASGTPTAPSPTGAGTPAVVVSASGAATAPHPTAVGSESLAPVSVSGAVTALLPSASGSAVRLGGIQCDHPRPKLELPGYTPPRLAWQPPAYLPLSLEGLQRAIKEGFQGIFNELMKAGARRNIVPLIDDINAREGQVITGVADGQVITMPIPTPGQLGQVSVIVTDVITPVTVVNPDGSTLTLDQPGTYQIATGPGENAWQPPPGVSSSGSAGGAGYFVDAAHASVPNARVGTTSTEITVDISLAHVVSFALRTASVALSKLQNLAGLSILARAANSSGVMAALTATGGGQYFRSNAGGTALEVADPASTSIVNTAGTLVRAALTGDVTAAQNVNATTIAAHAVTNAKLAQIVAGSVKGLQIDATSPGDVVDLTGAEVGELIRRAFVTDYAGATGTIDDFPLDARINVLRINPGSLGGDVTITGFKLGAIGGTTGNAGGFFVLVKQGASNVVTLAHEDTGSSSNNRLELPLFQNVILTDANSAVVWQYLGGRWQIAGQTVLSGQLLGRLLKYTTYAAGTSGTHTFQAGTTYWQCEMVGGGGGGGAADSAAAQSAVAAGGGAGAWVAFDDTSTAALAYSVGTGGNGAAAASAGANGSAGAATTLGTRSVDPGNGGQGSANANGSGSGTTLRMTGPGGTGGSSTGGSFLHAIFAPGEDGRPGVCQSATLGWGGTGGKSFYGVGTAPGAGGIGRLSTNGTDQAGSIGTGGVIRIWEYS